MTTMSIIGKDINKNKAFVFVIEKQSLENISLFGMNWDK